MNALQKTLSIIAFLALSTQTVRHAYLLGFEPRTSVLDRFDQPLKGDISRAQSLEELVSRYEPVRKQTDEARQQLSKAGKTPGYTEESQTEPYKSEKALREAITEWEGRSKEIRELRVYWGVGFVFFVLGALAYRTLGRWSGLTLLIAAFAEFICWTSPSFLGNGREFDRLLVNKLVLSVLSLILLVAVIWRGRIFYDQGGQSAG